jgi:hypothetical protein
MRLMKERNQQGQTEKIAQNVVLRTEHSMGPYDIKYMAMDDGAASLDSSGSNSINNTLGYGQSTIVGA